MDQQRVLARRVAALRIAFGLIWAVDAGFKWTGSFVHGFRDTIAGAGQGQPGWLRPWFHFWLKTVGNHGSFFAYATAAIETLIATGLIFGFGRRAITPLPSCSAWGSGPLLRDLAVLTPRVQRTSGQGSCPPSWPPLSMG